MIVLFCHDENTVIIDVSTFPEESSHTLSAAKVLSALGYYIYYTWDMAT
jgi:hypothetical protein